MHCSLVLFLLVSLLVQFFRVSELLDNIFALFCTFFQCFLFPVFPFFSFLFSVFPFPVFPFPSVSFSQCFLSPAPPSFVFHFFISFLFLSFLFSPFSFFSCLFYAAQWVIVVVTAAQVQVVLRNICSRAVEYSRRYDSFAHTHTHTRRKLSWDGV